MKQKTKFLFYLSIFSAVALCGSVFTGSNGKPLSNLFSGNSLSNSNYSLHLDSNNAPTNFDTSHVVYTDAQNPISIQYMDASTLSGKHVHLNKGGSLIIESKLSGVHQVTADFDGEFHVESGLKNTNLSITKLEPNKTVNLGDGYSFNYVKFVADEEVDLTSMNLIYSCSEPGKQNVAGASVSAIGAEVYGVKELDYLGNDVHLHVDPFMGNTISSVLVNGKNASYNSDLKCYEYEAGTDDVVEVITSLTEHQTITVQNYIIDENTGDVTPDGEPYEEIPTVSADGYSYTVTPMVKDGYVVDKEYYKSVRDSEHDSVNFYYSKESIYNSQETSTSLSGDGTIDNPYLIKSAADYVYFKTNFGASTTANKNKYFKMTCSVDLTGLPTAQVMFGKSGVAFSGDFEGNNTRITYNINTTSVRQSLFYNVQNGTIKNFCTYGSNQSSTGAAGVVVFVNPNGLIENISNYATVKQYGGNAVSGILGDQWGGTVRGCTNYASVTDIEGNRNKTAGICGVVEKDGGVLEDCFNFGAISGTTMVAGIVPFANSNITLTLKNVYNFGSVTQTGNGNISGIISSPNLEYVSLDGCYNFGTLTNNGAASSLCGGVSDYVISATTESKNVVKNCMNFADISSTNNTNMGGCFTHVKRAYAVDSVWYYCVDTKLEFIGCKNYGDITTEVSSGDTPVGGILGSCYVKAGSPTTEQTTKCYSAHVDFTNCENYGYIDGTQRTGGIVGWSYTSNITNCINCGDLGTRSGAVSKEWNGGIVGTSYNNASKVSTLVVTSCSNFGTIKVSLTAAGGITGSPSGNSTFVVDSCNNFGDVISGNTYAAGIVGQISGAIISATLNSCSNYGDISGNDYVAGIAGNTKVASYVCDNVFINKGNIYCSGTHFGEFFSK